MKNQALFFYARELNPNFVGKTRLGFAIQNQPAASALAQALIEDMRKEYTPKHNEYILYSAKDFPELDLEQVGPSMNTIFKQLLQKHDRVIIIGSDLPEISYSHILHTFEQLKKHPLIITPTIDNGYGLIGMNKYVDIFSQIENFESRTAGYNLLEETELLVKEKHISLYKQSLTYDIDYPFDVARTRRFIITSQKEQIFSRTLAVLRKFPELYTLSVSIIIPVYNEHSFILKTLNQIKQLKNSETLDWIFVDGGSSDMTPKLIQNFIDTHQQYQIRLLTSTGGRGGALAHGAKKAFGEILAFVHADTSIPNNFAQLIQTCIKQYPSVVGGAFTLQFDNSAWHYQGIALYSTLRSKIFQTYHGDQAMFIRRNVLDKIGGYPNMPIMEDVILSKKMKRFGHTILLKKKIVSSSRRIKKTGFIFSIFLYFFMKIAFFLGVPPKYLKRIYS